MKEAEGKHGQTTAPAEKVEAVEMEQVKIGDVRAIDGKTLRGTIQTGETQGARLLSIYQVNQCATLPAVRGR